MRIFTVFVLALVTQALLVADELPGTLAIGDKAPALSVEHWIQDNDGELSPVTDFADGRVYVIEFWGTWCPPCLMVMPALAEMQTKHGYDNLRLVSVSTEKPDVIHAFLKRNVPGTDQTYGQLTSVYSLTADPDKSVYKDYMVATGAFGVPMAFVIGKSGLLEWIGNPGLIDSPLNEIIEDRWDREKFALSYSRTQQVLVEVRRLSMFRQQNFKKPDVVLKEVEKAVQRFSKFDVAEMHILRVLRVRALTEADRPADAEAALREMLNSGDYMQVFSAASVLPQISTASKVDTKRLAALAIEQIRGTKMPKSELSELGQQMADGQKQMVIVRLYALAGEKEKAIEAAKSAVKGAASAQGKQMAQQVLKQLQSETAE